MERGMTAPISFPLRTVAGLNAREHWRARARRVKAEREAAAWALHGASRPPLPLLVRLWRIAPSNGLDDDNLAGALKAVRDEVAVFLGVDDRDRRAVRYVYEQRRGARGEWAVGIEWLEWPEAATTAQQVAA
jgi:hypothetical protein